MELKIIHIFVHATFALYNGVYLNRNCIANVKNLQT